MQLWVVPRPQREKQGRNEVSKPTGQNFCHTSSLNWVLELWCSFRTGVQWRTLEKEKAQMERAKRQTSYYTGCQSLSEFHSRRWLWPLSCSWPGIHIFEGPSPSLSPPPSVCHRAPTMVLRQPSAGYPTTLGGLSGIDQSLFHHGCSSVGYLKRWEGYLKGAASLESFKRHCMACLFARTFEALQGGSPLALNWKCS